MFEEFDAPGAGRRPPLLEATIARVEAGLSGGLVMAHPDCGMRR
jgi:hypothetical protein